MSPETVEQLSEQIVSQYVGGAYLSGCARDCREKIEAWLRSHGIDPATMVKAPLTLHEAKERRLCRICGKPDRNGREAWTYNFGKEYAHTKCLHPASVEDIHVPTPPPTDAPREQDAIERDYREPTPPAEPEVRDGESRGDLMLRLRRTLDARVDERDAYYAKSRELEQKLAATEAKLREYQEYIAKANKALLPFIETFKVIKDKWPPHPTNAESE